MPVAVSYPGVYVEEVPSGVRTITAVPTSVTAFIGRTAKGPVDAATEITNYGDFERIFGGLSRDSAVSYAVRDFYLNGGARAVIVRLFHGGGIPDDQRDAVLSVATAGAGGADKATAVNAANARKTEVDKNQSDDLKNATKSIVAAFEALLADATAEAIKKAADDASAAVPPPSRRIITVGSLKFAARYPGAWAADLRVQIERPYDTSDKDKDPVTRASAIEAAKQLGVNVEDLFTLTVSDRSPGGRTETFTNVTLRDKPRRVDRVLKEESTLLTWSSPALDTPPELNDAIVKLEKGKPARAGDAVAMAEWELAAVKSTSLDPTKWKKAQDDLDKAVEAARASAADSAELETGDYLPPGGTDAKQGLYALEQLFTFGGIFNLLCIPPDPRDENLSSVVLSAASAYCEKRRAMLIVDPPTAWDSVAAARTRFGSDADSLPRSRNAAVFFPRVNEADPLQDDQSVILAPCGVVCGIFARTDVQRGVWKSPAGLDASLVGVSKVSIPMTDEENGLLNPLGINCLRTFPVFGRVVWGARTLRGADDYADEYKYVAVRRTALFIEESLFRGLKWVVFEPNDEPLWAQIRLNVGAFMHTLFRQGAFQGATPREAYFVRCDSSTTTQTDINSGIVNINVGFAPLKPAEFVVIRLQQMAGQIET